MKEPSASSTCRRCDPVSAVVTGSPARAGDPEELRPAATSPPENQATRSREGPKVRVPLPPAVSLRTIGSRKTRSSLKRHLYIPGHLRQTVAPAADLSGGVIRQGWRFLRRKVV